MARHPSAQNYINRKIKGGHTNMPRVRFATPLLQHSKALQPSDHAATELWFSLFMGRI